MDEIFKESTPSSDFESKRKFYEIESTFNNNIDLNNLIQLNNLTLSDRIPEMPKNILSNPSKAMKKKINEEYEHLKKNNEKIVWINPKFTI